MKVLAFATLNLVFSGGLTLMAGGESFDLDRIRTENGRVYEDILILGSDTHGLLFRHRKGIAKIDFEQLSMNLRMLYEPVGDVPTESTDPDSEPDPAGSRDLFGGRSVTITAANRITVPLTTGWTGRWNRCRAWPCVWPMHWPRYQPALRLAVPECRALAVEDFLITTGLIPRPPGVRTYRLPYNYADLRF